MTRFASRLRVIKCRSSDQRTMLVQYACDSPQILVSTYEVTEGDSSRPCAGIPGNSGG